MSEPRLRVALETSTRRPSVAASYGGARAELALDGERAHASDLVPALESLLRELGAQVGALEALVVGRGPGSYTGLRVGVATAIGLALGSGARALGLASGEALAWAELAPGETLCHLVDVRQGALAFARYRREAEEVVALEPPRLVAREEATALAASATRVAADEGAASALDPALLAGGRVRADLVPRASALLELGERRLARGLTSGIDELEPLYLRPFRAVPRRR